MTVVRVSVRELQRVKVLVELRDSRLALTRQRRCWASAGGSFCGCEARSKRKVRPDGDRAGSGPVC